MIEQWFDPRVSQRLKQVIQLSAPPSTMSEFSKLVKKEYFGNPKNQEFMKRVRAEERVIAFTKEDHGYSMTLPNDTTPKVECAADTLITALLRPVKMIHATCTHCGEKMQIKIEGKHVASASLPSIVFWLGGGERTGIVMLEGKNIPEDPICNHIHLFPNRDHLAEWLKTKEDEHGIVLPLNDAVQFFSDMVID